MAAERVLGFTNYQSTPSYVPREGVVVQVWAVGVDGVDAKLVGLRPGSAKPRNDNAPILGDRNLVAEPESQDEGRNGYRHQNGYSGETEGEETEREDGPGRPTRGGRVGRSTSLRERLGSFRLKGGKKKDKSVERSGGSAAEPLSRRPTLRRMKDKSTGPPPTAQPQVGFIPGRSFVGRVVETGLDVKEDYLRRNDWVIGILDARKSGALAEYIVVDRHRVRRVPHPASIPGEESRNATSTTTSFQSYSSSSTRLARLPPNPAASLTLEELALLPLTGLQAYRAVQTFTRAFAGQNKGTAPRPVDYPSFAAALNDGTFLGGRNHQVADHDGARHRRALVLRGHDGIGAMAVQMLKMRGWRVSVHIPVPGPHEHEDIQRYMSEAESRAADLGGEEVVFDDGGNQEDPWWDEGRGAAARLIDWLNADGDVYDAVLDTIGGKEIREASERLLRSLGKDEDMILPEGNRPVYRNLQKTGHGQFTTTVGDEPDRIVPSFGESFRANMRSIKGGGSGGITPAELEGGLASPGVEGLKGKPGYQWVGVSQDIDLQGEDVADTLGHVIRLALEYGIKPLVPRISVATESAVTYRYKDGIVPFEKTPEIFVDGDGPFSNGGTMVVKVVKS
ncbi:hypothetical protein BKA70DRAFT_1094178 [Coprinopsis sp. MPI-PUGE-AT-0042]|nr:hypothetical protein BKA70DRAFT_1094178 [Coprinopsis sp. MPI-PUGE-AT-0042]